MQTSLATKPVFNTHVDAERELYKSHIETTVLNRFPDASVILLCGSQGRALSNGIHLPQKNSDYDFVILYDKFDEKIASSMFSCQKLYIPEENRTISIDYKVFDTDSFNDHINETVNIRRFPFLFNMIRDGHIVKGDAVKVAELKALSESIVTEGPAPLSTQQNDQEIAKLQNLLSRCERNNGDLYEIKDIALTAANQIPQSILRLRGHWESGTNRIFNYLFEVLPVQSEKFMTAYKQAIEKQDLSLLGQIAADTLQDYIIARETSKPYIETIYNPDIDRSVADIKAQSDQNLCRIMIDQYLDRLEIAYTRGEGYELGTQASLWETIKKMTILMDKTECQETQNLMKNFADKVIEKDYIACRNIADAILNPVGGLNFEYLERPYTDDLKRRIALKTPKNA